ncbi:pilus assembly protein TadG-related protein [Bradyrhizobium elkanii]|uniref:Flp pilus assembly protein TadG n=1 Tax=Bradyrhizobium elkanii TaxID=29448 RepID=A0ABV4EXI3_BRAEL|nr:pilus assembly protein TadG-related protein [Bradyrhizobium elkanii]MCP1756885.1 Flp pilus assembly protein TadG [Bradyrhizobium elkanii]MCP1982398.1 Flp pilus assembly protein TadG [Bradyrhizobium elkanii]MCS3882818.1 Flp pilus assembly protein TadG [Bradyrhizobium elkanii]MCS4218125.1 Flp pilus assembly protein TadG [Bradyrhizobium elkanii]MCW2195425.1 Flp pilus assembly protein TadG [Bradyrhizobium elkanii]
MRNILRSRRGSVAFATVIALVPAIGFVALGGEAGSWYVTKQRAQSAADAAAYSGALRLACDTAPQPGVSCNNTQAYDYRGRQAAAQNAFCNSGDTSYSGSKCSSSLGSGVSQSVQVASLTSWNGTPGTYVQATVGQQQPAYIAKALGLSTINLNATAVARIDNLAKPPCVLALKDSVTFQGSPTVSSSTCGISSDSSASNAIGFVGNNGIQVSAPSYTVGGCSQTGGSQCTGVLTYQQPIPDPLSAVGAAMAKLKLSDFPGGTAGQCASLQSYEAGSCCNVPTGNFDLSGTLNGTYYFCSGNIRIRSSSTTVTSGALGTTLIFLMSATLTVSGGPLIQITAVKNPAGPSTLSTVSSKMIDLLIYDGEAYSSGGVSLSGSSSSYFNGTVYIPNTPVTYGGNSLSTAPSPGCYQVIAYAVKFQGDTKLDNSKCKSDGAATPTVQTVRLMQQWQ